MKRTAAVLALFTIAAAAAILIGARSQQPPSPTRQTYRGWPGYGGGPEQIRYSQPRPDQPRQREAARTGVDSTTAARPAVCRRSRSSSTACSTRYTPTHKTFALRAATGEHAVDVRLGHQRRRAEPRRRCIGASGADDRRVFAAVDPLRLRARRGDRNTGSHLRRQQAVSICGAISAAIPNSSRCA